MMILILYY